MTESQFSYRPFASQGFYQVVNRQLVDMVDFHPGQRVVDLACGTGAVTKLIVEKLRGARDSFVIGIDMSALAIREAMAQFVSVKDVALEFIHSRAEQLSVIVKEQVDGVVFCNGIHMVPDKTELMGEVAATLRPGGIFAFNTTFFNGSIPEESEQFYRRWMSKSIRSLKKNYDMLPSRDVEKVAARIQLTVEEYEELLAQSGFSIQRKDMCPAPMDLEGFLAISQYEAFIEGAMPGVPLEQGSASLQAGARQAFEELQLKDVPRNWLTVVATKN
jgi:ubiquinone/menaquinone biosynthesis C-methylase UbiE